MHCFLSLLQLSTFAANAPEVDKVLAVIAQATSKRRDNLRFLWPVFVPSMAETPQKTGSTPGLPCKDQAATSGLFFIEIQRVTGEF